MYTGIVRVGEFQAYGALPVVFRAFINRIERTSGRICCSTHVPNPLPQPLIAGVLVFAAGLVTKVVLIARKIVRNWIWLRL